MIRAFADDCNMAIVNTELHHARAEIADIVTHHGKCFGNNLGVFGVLFIYYGGLIGKFLCGVFRQHTEIFKNRSFIQRIVLLLHVAIFLSHSTQYMVLHSTYSIIVHA